MPIRVAASKRSVKHMFINHEALGLVASTTRINASKARIKTTSKTQITKAKKEGRKGGRDGGREGWRKEGRERWWFLVREECGRIFYKYRRLFL
jgi:hypothetical protein